jgi:hypothetical protein
MVRQGEAIGCLDDPLYRLQQCWLESKVRFCDVEQHFALRRIVLDRVPDPMCGHVIGTLPTSDEKPKQKKEIRMKRIPCPRGKPRASLVAYARISLDSPRGRLRVGFGFL